MAAQLRRAAAACVVLALLGACSPPQGSAPAVSAQERGAQIFQGNCAACHQADGAGIAHVYPPLAGSAVVNGDPAVLVRWVVKGERPAALPAGRYSAMMPQYGWLGDADAAALLSHLRSHFGNSAAALSAADVARALGR